MKKHRIPRKRGATCDNESFFKLDELANLSRNGNLYEPKREASNIQKLNAYSVRSLTHNYNQQTTRSNSRNQRGKTIQLPRSISLPLLDTNSIGSGKHVGTMIKNIPPVNSAKLRSKETKRENNNSKDTFEGIDELSDDEKDFGTGRSFTLPLSLFEESPDTFEGLDDLFTGADDSSLAHEGSSSWNIRKLSNSSSVQNTSLPPAYHKSQNAARPNLSNDSALHFSSPNLPPLQQQHSVAFRQLPAMKLDPERNIWYGNEAQFAPFYAQLADEADQRTEANSQFESQLPITEESGIPRAASHDTQYSSWGNISTATKTPEQTKVTTSLASTAFFSEDFELNLDDSGIFPAEHATSSAYEMSSAGNDWFRLDARLMISWRTAEELHNRDIAWISCAKDGISQCMNCKIVRRNATSKLSDNTNDLSQFESNESARSYGASKSNNGCSHCASYLCYDEPEAVSVQGGNLVKFNWNEAKMNSETENNDVSNST